MHFPFTRQRHAAAPQPTPLDNRHQMTSDYRDSLCRFVLDCTCGAHFDTPFIDEALEIREMHLTLAPMSDQLQP